jgi:hypothetical protein
MIILGHNNDFNPEQFWRVKNSDEVAETPSNSTIIFDFDFDLLKFSKENSVNVAVFVSSLTEAILSENLRAKYILVEDFKLAEKVQEIADKYVFDAKIIVPIETFDKLEIFAEKGIDGVILF